MSHPAASIRAVLCLALLHCSSAALVEGASHVVDASDAHEGALPDVQNVGIAAVKAWATHRLARGERSFAGSGHSRQPSPYSWAGKVVYEIMPDRFNNGNTSNDGLNVPDWQQEQMARGDLGSMPDWRHGGDIQGIRDRLGYLADLGVQALWITPVLMHTGFYHGYCATDPTTTDPGFGTPEELRLLVAEAHSYGMAVVLDVVINHMCDEKTVYVGAPDHTACTESKNNNYWTGGLRHMRGKDTTDAAKLSFSPHFFAPFRNEAFFNRCGPNELGETGGLGPSTIFGDFTLGMFDYNTENQDWQQIFTDLMKYWIAFADLDGFRLDAAKHVTTDFLAYFSTEVRAYAKTLGKDNFLIIGEVAADDETWKADALGLMASNPQDPQVHGHVPQALTKRLLTLKDDYLSDPIFPAPGLTSVYNFYQSGVARTALRCEDTPLGLQGYFGSEPRQTLLQQSVPQRGAERDAQLWTNIEIHDWPRFLGLQPNRTDLLEAAMVWLLTSPGAPVLYYGIEQGLNGYCPETIDIESAETRATIRSICDAAAHEGYGAHPDSMKRQDMFMGGPWRLGSSIPAVDHTAHIGSPGGGAASEPWQKDAMLPRNHELYRLTRKLAALRGSCPVLAMGSIAFHVATPVSCGFVAFSRLLSAPEAAADTEVVVLINPGGQAHPVESFLLQGSARRTDGQGFVNVFNPKQGGHVEFRDNRPYFVLREPIIEETAMIFVQEGETMPFNNALGIALCRTGSEEGLQGIFV